MQCRGTMLTTVSLPVNPRNLPKEEPLYPVDHRTVVPFKKYYKNMLLLIVNPNKLPSEDWILVPYPLHCMSGWIWYPTPFNLLALLRGDACQVDSDESFPVRIHLVTQCSTRRRRKFCPRRDSFHNFSAVAVQTRL